MKKNSENLNHELEVINDRCTDLEDRLYRERNLRKRVEQDLHELEKNMQDSSESDSSSSDDEIIYSPPDADRRQSKNRSRRKQQTKRHKKNSHKGKPCMKDNILLKIRLTSQQRKAAMMIRTMKAEQ